MPVITVSRMYGSSGSEVAERAAKALGWQFYDNDLIDAVAERAGLTHEEVAAREERVPSVVARVGTTQRWHGFVPRNSTPPTANRTDSPSSA